MIICENLFYNANIFNTAYKKFYRGFLATRKKKIVAIGEGEPSESIVAKNSIDLEGRFVIPGLIDIHTHIESAMLTPYMFARELARRGVTTIVSEPHEIANVAGIDAVYTMIDAAQGAPIDIFYSIPSSVPSSNPSLETTGGSIEIEDVLKLMEHPHVKALGEVMNVNSVLYEKSGKTNKLVKAFRKSNPMLPVEGHCPRIVGEELAKYIFSGIDSDHTEHTLEEMKQRLFNGMMMQIQEKTVVKELMDHIVENDLYNSVALVTDDVMPHELVENGHLDYIVKLATECGFSFENAVYCATKTPADRMRLFDRGSIRPGLLADFVILDDGRSFDVYAVYKSGYEVYSKERGDRFREKSDYSFPKRYTNSIKLGKITPENFTVRVPEKDTEKESVKVRRIVNSSPATQTKKDKVAFPVKKGEVVWENNDKDTLLITVFDRYKKSGNIGQGFVTGAVHKKGAVATTYNHDCHNLLVAGSNKKDMVLASNEVIKMKGGFAVALDGKIIASCPLPIGGIMSASPADELALKLGEVVKAMEMLGYNHVDPIMSFCTLTLAVSPSLKITDVGYVDVMNQKTAELFV
ncbi:MAG: adenine deaminase [Ruminococcaceae bacterium]|nr:adenine deaminase [Oscillospiraceae bacterium]